MAFSDLNGIVGKEVVPHELQVLAHGEESKDLSVIVQELLLRWNSSSSELLLEEFEQLLVLLWGNWLKGVDEGVLWANLSVSLGLANVLYKKRLQLIQKFKYWNKSCLNGYLHRNILWYINRNHKF